MILKIKRFKLFHCNDEQLIELDENKGNYGSHIVSDSYSYESCCQVGRQSRLGMQQCVAQIPVLLVFSLADSQINTFVYHTGDITESRQDKYAIDSTIPGGSFSSIRRIVEISLV